VICIKGTKEDHKTRDTHIIYDIISCLPHNQIVWVTLVMAWVQRCLSWPGYIQGCFIAMIWAPAGNSLASGWVLCKLTFAAQVWY